VAGWRMWLQNRLVGRVEIVLPHLQNHAVLLLLPQSVLLGTLACLLG
jgi:hypothetical protein